MAKPEQSRSKRGGTRRAAINLTDLRRSIKQLGDVDPSELELAERAMRSELRALQRSAAKRLESAGAGATALDKAGAIRADYETKRARLLKRHKTDIARAESAMGRRRALGIASRREALEALANPRLPFTAPSIVVKPLLIWATSDRPHSTILVNSHADPIGLSWGQVALDASSLPASGENTFRLQFWYLWQNDRDYYEVVNPKALLVLDGGCTVTADTGIFSGGESSVACQAVLNPLQWWESPTIPDPFQTDRVWDVFNVSASGGGLFSASDIDGVTLDSTIRELRYDLFVIPPKETAVILVQVSFYCDLDDGTIDIDFASTPPNDYPHSIQCQLQLELLTAPGLSGPVTLGNPVVSG
jgi:hypothetical protein